MFITRRKRLEVFVGDGANDSHVITDERHLVCEKNMCNVFPSLDPCISPLNNPKNL